MTQSGELVRRIPATSVSWALFAVNVGAFLLTLWTAGCDLRTLLAGLAVRLDPVAIMGCDFPLALLELGAKFNPLIARGEYWRLLASAFLHLNVMHLLFNMIGLLTFGRLAEMIFGHARFLAIYLITGIGGSLLSYLCIPSLSVGASGAFFGIAGALIVFFIVNRRVRAIAPEGQLGGLVALLVINAIFGLVQPNIDNFGHAGGLLSGLALGAALTPRITVVAAEDGAPVGLRKQPSPPMSWLVVPAALLLAWLVLMTFPGATLRR